MGVVDAPRRRRSPGPPRPPSRFDIFLVVLDPTVGREIRKTRPCVVVSPDELNHTLQTVIIAPMTTVGRTYPWRVPVTFGGKRGWVVLDQLRAVDRDRLVRRLGSLSASASSDVLAVLAELFAP
ncbi:MAG TPA: type II toxin-antitoxin system PemK/MazF family toxin [Chloroflexota bacterium]|nr:type II toxin-antitoxin system PemK/MazF family toxin [Chloroflexota bacterium]